MFNLTGSTLGYAIIILLATGAVLVKLDTDRLKRQNWRKEMKIARFAGWFNLAAGLGLLTYFLVT